MKVLLTSALRNPGMAAIRRLARCGVTVIGADDRRLPLNCRSRYLQKLYMHPPVTDENAFLEFFLAVIKKECPDVFFPIAGTHLIVKHAAEFIPHTRIMLPPFESHQTADNNLLTMQACRRLGIDCPRVFSDSAAESWLETGPRRLLVVKPHRNVGAARGVYYVGRRQDLDAARQRIQDWYGAYFIQEYIPGPTGNMLTVNLLFDHHSRLIAYFTTRKLRQWPNSGGISALSISTNDIGLVAKVLPFFEKYQWKGLAEVELKLDDRDQKTKVIEINPRVWSYFGFPVCCGVNFPLLYCRTAMGEKMLLDRIGSYRTGVKYLNPFAYAKAALEELRRAGRKSNHLLRLVRELQGKKTGNYMDLKDVRVIFAKLLFEVMVQSK